MVNNITTRTIYCIISLAAVVLALMACAACGPEIQEAGIRESEANGVVGRTVEVTVTEVVEQAGEVTREASATLMVTPTDPSPTPAPGAVSRPRPPSRLLARQHTLQVGHFLKARPI